MIANVGYEINENIITHKLCLITFLELGRQHNMAGNEDIVSRRLIPASGDILLGTVTVPMRQILTHKTGRISYFKDSIDRIISILIVCTMHIHYFFRTLTFA